MLCAIVGTIISTQKIYTVFLCLHQSIASIVNKFHCKKIENRCVSNIYLILIGPIFNKSYKQQKQIENTYELFLANFFLFLQYINSFRYIPKKNIERDILSWTMSINIFTTDYLLRLGYYNIYMSYNSARPTPPTPHDNRYVNIIRLSYI